MTPAKALPPAPRATRARSRLRGHTYAWVWLGLIALVVLTLIVAPEAATRRALLGELPIAAFLALAAIGQSVVLIGRGIDLSVPAVITLAAFVVVQRQPSGTGEIVTTILVVLGLSLLVGLCSGFLVAVVGINSIIATLAVNAVVLGAALLYTNGSTPRGHAAPELEDFMFGKTLGVANPAWVVLAIALLAAGVLRFTTAGRRFILFGSNADAARAMGIAVRRYEVSTYAIAALLYGVAGIMIAGYVSVPSVQVGDRYLLGTLAAAVVGGTAIGGGSGSFIAALGGAIFLTHLDQLVLAVNLSAGWQSVAAALIIAGSLAMRPAAAAARA